MGYFFTLSNKLSITVSIAPGSVKGNIDLFARGKWNVCEDFLKQGGSVVAEH